MEQVEPVAVGVKRVGRDARAALSVHAMGLVVAGASLGLVHLIGPTEEVANAVQGVGFAAGGVLVIWSLVLGWRVLKGESLWVPLAVAWLVLSEATGLTALLMVADARKWTGLGELPPFSWVLAAGLAMWLAVLWIATSVALAIVWWWVRWRAREAEPPERRRSLIEKFLILWIPVVVLLLPVALVAQAGLSPGFRKCVPAALVRWMPVYAQDAGLWLTLCLSDDGFVGAALIGNGYIDEEVLLKALESPHERWQWAASKRLTEIDSEEYYAILRREVRSPGLTGIMNVGDCMREVANNGSPARVAELLSLILEQPRPGGHVWTFIQAMGYRQGFEKDLRSLVGHPGVPADLLLGSLANHVSHREQKALFRERLNGDPQDRIIAGSALNYVRQPDSIGDEILELLRDTDPEVRMATLGSLWHTRFSSSRRHALLNRLVEMTDDADLGVRRQATWVLGQAAEQYDLLNSLAARSPSASETPAELGDRTRIVQAAKALLKETSVQGGPPDE